MKKTFGIYLFLSILIIVLSYIYHDRLDYENTSSISFLYFEDAVYIFLLNSMQLTFLIFVSIFGIHFYYIFNYLLDMGMHGAYTDTDPWIYYGSSFFHGFLEVLAMFIVLIISIRIYKELYLIIFKNESRSLKIWFKSFIKNLTILYSVLLLAALIEVYLSNRIINLFLGGVG